MKENVLSTSRKANDKITRLKMTIVQGKKNKVSYVYKICLQHFMRRLSNFLSCV